MIIKQLTFVALSLSLLSACALQAEESVPALLPENSNAARTEIVAVISNALAGKIVPIAQDVFQQTSRLLLTTPPVTSSHGVKVYSKEIKPALVFELRKKGDTCLLNRLDTEQEWPLKATSCFKR
ncbi:hypothetical protein [Colwellia psychrerythraea]|uniref:Lipoprotein n=1 Tax=Colwellia psychrerythraea TaxID=28229 RepID=A0A099K7S0_COLPS|nr:hypothetical protein [Colwellia psychrerythraea]KGJ86829.1 hypothetical protein GAB14E_4656 [Colwellia psychrerythraea]